MNPQDKQPNLPEPNLNNLNPVSVPNPPQPLDQSVNTPVNQPLHDPNQQLGTQNILTNRKPFYRKWLFWILVLLVLLLGWVGYSYFLASNDSPVSFFKILNLNSLKTNSPTNAESNKLSSLAQSTKTDATATWKTYTGTGKSTLHASFKYPSDWSIGGQSSSMIEIKSPDLKTTNFPSGQGYTFDSGSFIIVSYGYMGTDETLGKMAEGLSNLGVKCVYTTLGGIKAIEYTKPDQIYFTDKEVLAYTDNGNAYLIRQVYKEKSENPYPNAVDNIVSTFKIN